MPVLIFVRDDVLGLRHLTADDVGDPGSLPARAQSWTSRRGSSRPASSDGAERCPSIPSQRGADMAALPSVLTLCPEEAAQREDVGRLL